ncbi:MAG: SMC-Scp complex subunit ScpB [Candidatus Niyogibacteria bacterium]|nr:SMC-Scp complex subunit ScpB [Candidatus Niyogibacteria bacterium]
MALEQTIESLLFVLGEPQSIKKLAQLTQKDEKEIHEALEGLRKSLEGRGIRLVFMENAVGLVTSPESALAVGEVMKEEFSGDLSRAASETLAIIVYKGPLSRSDIDYIRGVNSTFTLRNLLIRGLVERTPNPKDARSYLYKPSIDLLKLFGISRIEDVPEFEEFHEKMSVPEEKEEKREE